MDRKPRNQNVSSDIRRALTSLELVRRQKLRPLFVELGLTAGQGQPRILESLSEQEGVTQTELAADCKIEATTLSRTLDHMENAGLLYRESDPECRRSRRVFLTEGGRETAESVEKIFASADEAFCKALTEDEASKLIVLLSALEEVLENMPAESSER